MNEALVPLSTADNDSESSRPTAIIIPINLPGTATSKRTRKKILPMKKEVYKDTIVPNFISAVFRPKKHDML
ncbi:MAG: hypothetical protein JWM28_1922 [Chitinophagaceae bacterium]|nr:hypothetical protein [Chitinophagaceae bacterium]